MEEPTLGMYRVGYSFNPSGDERVSAVKQVMAAAIDTMDDLSKSTDNPEVKRLCALASTHFEEGAMNAVKAFTKPELPVHLSR